MASVTGVSSNNTTDPYGSTNSSSAAASSSTGGTSGLANESTFLTLLVAQLQNQDPLQPADGMQFVEQSLAMRTDLDSINTKFTSTGSSGAAQ